jgi:hypothetical protein
MLSFDTYPLITSPGPYEFPLSATLTHKGIIHSIKSTRVSGYSRQNLVPPSHPSQASASPPRSQKVGSNTRSQVRAVGEPIRTTGQKTWHSVYSVILPVYIGEQALLLHQVTVTSLLLQRYTKIVLLSLLP